jgi:chromosome segregation protein
VRVQDIIKEVKRQIGSLQRQAAKARRYQSILADLRVFDTHISHKNYRQLSEEFDSLRQLNQGDERARSTRRKSPARKRNWLSSASACRNWKPKPERSAMACRLSETGFFRRRTGIGTNHERSSEASSLIDRHRLDHQPGRGKIRTQQEQIEQTDILLQQMIESLRTHQETFG